MKHRIEAKKEKEIPRPSTGKQTRAIIRHLVKKGESYAVKVGGAVKINKPALSWLSDRVGRKVRDITDLTWEEAGALIDTLPGDGIAAIIKE